MTGFFSYAQLFYEFVMNKKSIYDRCLEEMYGLRRFGIKLELSTIRTILKALDRPQDRFRSIHVAGTNGKGSTAAMLTTMLRQAGYRTGLYTSPHLVRFNERITINGRPISNSDVVDAYQAVKNKHGGKREPTFFEYTTAMAFYVFAQQNVDVAVIETGMGGRFDATNVLSPILSIITNISLEHREYLGNTLADIAREKAGIIKPGVPLITGVRQEPARRVIRRTAADKKADCFRLGEQFKIRKYASGEFSYAGIDLRLNHLNTRLAGVHQMENAALAVAAAEVLNRRGGMVINENHIRQGLLTADWPARMEIVSENPMILIDGAHNLAAAGNLGRFLATATGVKGKKILLVIGILDDKPYPAMLKKLVPLADRVILTRAGIGRAVAPEVLAPVVRSLNRPYEIVDTVAGAVRRAVSRAAADEVICISGSLYVAGEARHALIGKGRAQPGI